MSPQCARLELQTQRLRKFCRFFFFGGGGGGGGGGCASDLELWHGPPVIVWSLLRHWSCVAREKNAVHDNVSDTLPGPILSVHYRMSVDDKQQHSKPA